MTDPSTPFVTANALTISLDDAVDGASAIIRKLCGWHIWPQVTDTVQIAPQGGSLLVLPTLKLASVTSVTVNGEALDMSTVTVWEHGVIERNPDDGDSSFWRCPNYWPTFGTVSVVFVHGYDTVPPEIKAVCQSLAARWPQSASQWATRKMGSTTLETGKGLAAIQPGALTVVEQMVIDRYTLKPQP